VSYFVPCYNYGRYVSQAVDSLLSQSFEDLEVIVVDDLSTDESREVLEHYRPDPRVRLIYHKVNAGHISTYNEAIRLARGQYIGLLSADDYLYDPDAIRRQVELFRSNPDIGLVYSGYMMVDATGEELWYHRPWCGDYVREGLDEFSNLIFQDYIHSVNLASRAALDAVGLYEPTLPECADWDLWLRISTRFAIGYVDAPLYAYRRHGINMSTTLSTRRHVTDERLRVVTRAFDALQPDARAEMSGLERPARTSAWLRSSEIDAAQGNLRRSWEGLTDAVRRCPSLLKSRRFYRVLLKLTVQSVLGRRLFNRLWARIRPQSDHAGISQDFPKLPSPLHGYVNPPDT
jgi:glycosyltransferase involved in cell wall biosynthesis